MTSDTPTTGSRPAGDAGFTLLELLIVVVIVGILATIAISAFVTQRDQARDAAVVSDLRHAYVISTGYSIEQSGTLPPTWESLLEAGHQPSNGLRPEEGADVRYRPDEGCLSIAHSATPERPHQIDLEDGTLVLGAVCD